MVQKNLLISSMKLLTVQKTGTSVSAAAKAQGVTIYCIGLSGNGGIDEQALNDWASTPSSAYVVITPSDEELENIFSDLAKNISKPGAKDIVIKDVISSCFKIISLSTPTKGTASLLNETSLQWKIDELGAHNSEGASLEFTVEHIGPCSGTVEVNESISYDDKDHNVVTFPSPVPIDVDRCETSVEFDCGDVQLDSLGRIIELDVTLKNICPNLRVALAVIITEIDSYGMEHKRGVKTMTIPAHTKQNCSDVIVRCIKFVLPEDLDVSGSPHSICNKRKFKARFIANYIDNDFKCCSTFL